MAEALDLVSTAEAAEILGRAVPTVTYYMRGGDLTPALEGPGIRGAKFFHRADVEALKARLDAKVEAS